MDFRLLADTIPHLIWSARADGAVDYVNARFLGYLGQSLEETLGWDWLDTVHPDDRQAVAGRWAESLAKGSEHYVEFRMRRGDDRYCWHAGRAVPARDAAGHVVRWFGTCTDIDERKRLEDRLFESEVKFRALHQNMRDGFASVDMHGRFMEFSAAYLAMLGYTEDELYGKTYVDLTPPRWHALEERILNEQILPRGYSDVYEKEYRRKDGTLVPVELCTSLVRSADGTPRQMWAVVRDISARKAAEALHDQARLELEHERDILRAIMNGADNVHLVYLDRDFNFVHVNDTYARGCGYRPAEMIGKNHFSLYPHAENEAIFARVRETGEAATFHDKPFVYPDQPERGVTYWDWSLTPAKDASGEIIGLVYSLVETTARKRVENQLAASEERYRAIVENQTEYVARFAPGGVLTYVNDALAQWHGMEPAALVGSSFYPFLHEEDRDGVVRAIEALTCDQPLVTIEQRLPMPDGSMCWQQWVNRILCDEHGHLLEYQGVGRDVTAQKEAEQYLAKAKETLEREVRERTAALTAANARLTGEIEERQRAQDDLLDYQCKLEAMSLELALAADRERARIAGELHDEVGQRLILSRIKLDALESQVADPEQQRAVQELRRLIDQTVTDIRTLTFHLRPPVLAAGGLVAALEWLGQELQEHYGLGVEVRGDASPLALPYETKSILFQIVRELLLNVAKHADTDRAAVSVSTVANALNITVEDRGAGFDVETVLAGRGLPGGFGIFSIQQRIKHLGGAMEIAAQPGEGSRVTITVPLAAERVREGR